MRGPGARGLSGARGSGAQGPGAGGQRAMELRPVTSPGYMSILGYCTYIYKKYAQSQEI